MYIPPILHLFVNGPVRYFHILANGSDAAVNEGIQVCLADPDVNFFGYILFSKDRHGRWIMVSVLLFVSLSEHS